MDALTRSALDDALRAGGVGLVRAPIGWVAIARPAERERLLALPDADPARLGVTAGDRALLAEFLPPLGLRATRLLERLLPGDIALRLGDDRPLARLDAWAPEGGPWLTMPLERGAGASVAPEAAAERWHPAASALASDGPRVDETIVRVDGWRVAVENPPTPHAARIAEAARLRLLCVCSGNTCRSPMLAALTRRALADRGIDAVEVLSAGVHAGDGEPASEHGVTAMAARSIDLSGHRSRSIDRLDLDGFDRIWCLGRGHYAALRSLGVPEQRLRIVNAAEGGVPDPYGGELADYEACARVLEHAIEAIIGEL